MSVLAGQSMTLDQVSHGVGTGATTPASCECLADGTGRGVVGVVVLVQDGLRIPLPRASSRSELPLCLDATVGSAKGSAAVGRASAGVLVGIPGEGP